MRCGDLPASVTRGSPLNPSRCPLWYRLRALSTSFTHRLHKRYSARYAVSLPRFRERERQRLPDAAAGDEHDDAVDAHSQTPGGRHRVLHRLQEVLVELHGFWIAAGGQQGLLLQAAPLLHRVGELAVGGAQLDAP